MKALTEKLNFDNRMETIAWEFQKMNTVNVEQAFSDELNHESLGALSEAARQAAIEVASGRCDYWLLLKSVFKSIFHSSKTQSQHLRSQYLGMRTQQIYQQ
jgi:hypothetical protein